MEIGAIIIIIVVGIILILTFYVIGLYNRLIDAKSKVEDKFKQIDIEIEKVMDLVPTVASIVRENTKHEEKKIGEVMIGIALVVDAEDINERIKFFKGLTGVLKDMLDLSKTYPELKKNKIFNSFQKSFKESEGKINYASSFYNEVVDEYNKLRKTFPLSLVAIILNIKEIDRCEIDK